MQIENARIHAREGIYIPVSHREYQTCHAAHVEPEYSKPLLTHEGQPAGLRDGEFEITNLSLEILHVDPDEGRVGPNERSRRDGEATPREVFA